MNITNVSVEAKKTLDFLIKNFPEIIDCVPNNVLEFGIPNQDMTIGFAILTSFIHHYPIHNFDQLEIL